MNNIQESRSASVLGGRTARACENCLLKRARWFCAADDAFLCQACDVTVHSANQLAGRHHRVRLKTASFKGSSELSSWHQGFTKKARTRRKPAKLAPVNNLIPVVPEINWEELVSEEKEEMLVHRVPEFDDDPFVNEFKICGGMVEEEEMIGHDLNLGELLNGCDEFGDLLGSEKILDEKRVKVEDDEVEAVIASHLDPKLDMEMSWDFEDYEYSMIGEEEGGEKKRVFAIEEYTSKMESENGSQVEKRMLLRLNYEEIFDAWASRGSPWENGIRPHLDLNGFMAECVREESYLHKGTKGLDRAEREARVSRYKEKRRTRLFSKKIRYEVRKLNAEKRPRMKGRFIKRANFLGSSLSNT